MPKSIYVQHLAERHGVNIHYLNRLIKLLNHFITIEPDDKPKGFECHHIVPKSWKPEWSKEPDNLLKVPAKTHYVIHHLMWKAFPEDHAMAIAFYVMNNRLHEKITSKKYKILKDEFCESQKQNNLKRITDGTHPFLGGEIAKKSALKQVVDGTHPFLGGEIQRKTNAERIRNGNHHWLGPKSNLKRIIDKSHNFLGSESNMKMLVNGNHPSQIKKICPHCGKTISSGPFKRWHGDKCKSLFEKHI